MPQDPQSINIGSYVIIFMIVTSMFNMLLFNPFAGYYSSPNIRFDNTNLTPVIMTDSESAAYYHYDQNATPQVPALGLTMQSMASGDIVSLIVNLPALIIQIGAFIFSIFKLVVLCVYNLIYLWFGPTYANTIGVIIQTPLDYIFVKTLIQLFTGRAFKVLT